MIPQSSPAAEWPGRKARPADEFKIDHPLWVSKLPFGYSTFNIRFDLLPVTPHQDELCVTESKAAVQITILNKHVQMKFGS
jgi:hypothetical protein